MNTVNAEKPQMIVETELVLRDKDGNIIPIFNENLIGDYVTKLFGKCPHMFPFGMYKSQKIITNN